MYRPLLEAALARWRMVAAGALILLEQPEVVATTRRTGRAELDPHAQQVFASEIDVTLEMGDRVKETLLAALRQRFAAIPGTNVINGQPISHRIDHMLSGTRANVAVKIFGEDLFELLRLGSLIESLMQEVLGAVDVAMDQWRKFPSSRCANVADRDLISVADDIRRAITLGVELPRGYHIEYGGQFESAELATNRLVLLARQ
jgi:Cu/Ag efflux pump CusA